MRPFLTLFVLAAAGCGAQSYNDLFKNAKVQAAYAAYQAKVPDNYCRFDTFKGDATPFDITGTWTTQSCDQRESSDGTGDGNTCEVSLTFSNQTGNQITQSNVGAVSSGSGVVGFFNTYTEKPGVKDIEIAQSNHATGEGCTQDIINLLQFQQNDDICGGQQTNGICDDQYPWHFCIMTVVLSSTCPAVDWKVSEGYWDKPFPG